MFGLILCLKYVYNVLWHALYGKRSVEGGVALSARPHFLNRLVTKDMYVMCTKNTFPDPITSTSWSQNECFEIPITCITCYAKIMSHCPITTRTCAKQFGCYEPKHMFSHENNLKWLTNY